LGVPAAEDDAEQVPRPDEPSPATVATPLEELEILWETLGAVTSPGPDYRELMEQTNRSIRTVGQLGQEGQGALHDYLRRADAMTSVPPLVHYAYLDAKPTIIEVLAETGFNEAVPTLIEIVAPAEAVTLGRGASLSGLREFSYYRQIAAAAVPALESLGDASAVLTLRAAFDVTWEWCAHGAPLFNLLPQALVALGDADYLAQYLLRHLQGDNPREAFYAAHIAQYVPAPLMTPQLIAYFVRTNDPAARWALQSTTGQYYVDARSWNEWWTGAVRLPPSDWTSLDPTTSRRRRWAASVNSLIDEEFLRCGPLKWWEPRQAGYSKWKAAALHLAEIVQALAITEPVSEHLRTRLGDETCTSCVRKTCVACPTRGVPRRVRSGTGAGDPQAPALVSTPPPEIPGLFEVPIRTNAAKLLAAIDCVGAGSCTMWDEWAALEGITGVELETDSCGQRRMAAAKAARGDVEVTATARRTVVPAEGTMRTFAGKSVQLTV